MKKRNLITLILLFILTIITGLVNPFNDISITLMVIKMALITFIFMHVYQSHIFYKVLTCMYIALIGISFLIAF